MGGLVSVAACGRGRVSETVQGVAREVGTVARAYGLRRALPRPWYGDIVVGSGAQGLTIDFTSTPRMAGRLKHWQYDSFVTDFDDPAIDPAYVTFALDAEGKITGVTLKAVSKIADFSWDYHDLDLKPVEDKK